MSVIDAFLDALWLEQGASDHTLAAYRRDLTAWQNYLVAQGDDILSPAFSSFPYGSTPAGSRVISCAVTPGCYRVLEVFIAGRACTAMWRATRWLK